MERDTDKTPRPVKRDNHVDTSPPFALSRSRQCMSTLKAQSYISSHSDSVPVSASAGRYDAHELLPSVSGLARTALHMLRMFTALGLRERFFLVPVQPAAPDTGSTFAQKPSCTPQAPRNQPMQHASRRATILPPCRTQRFWAPFIFGGDGGRTKGASSSSSSPPPTEMPAGGAVTAPASGDPMKR